MIRTCFVIATALTLILALVPVSGVSVAGEFKAGAWKFGTVAPKGVGYAIHVDQIIMKEIEKATDGKVKVKIYWGGVLGDDEAVNEKLKAGLLQGAGFSGHGSFLACKELSIVALPFLFSDFDEVDYIRKKMIGAFEKIMNKNGYALIAWVDQDFDQIYSITKPIARAADFKDVTFITWAGPVEEKMLLALSAMPIPTRTTEVVRVIKKDKIDGNIGPAIWVVGTQLYSKFRYINPIKIRYTPGSMMLSTKAFDDLGTVYQNRFLAARDDMTRDFVEKVRESNEQCLAAMKKYGVKFVETSPEDLKELKGLTRPVWNQLVGVVYPQTLLSELLAHLKEYRAGKK